ncbi:hypothetical protein [Ralstonia soli]|uniref:Lipoprotein n=1 Tax=Ralstonia soli TaxID=2953896 RepID=A0ABT1AIV6_9RALS|nr:hypothetical protein [Ralstonia soli]MCO5398229.1 hypothetical protein [Ralstonia soli]
MKLAPIAIGAAALVLSACGGGGDSAPQQNSPQSQTISGVAATGAALSGATINVTCSAGSGTATTGADGSYSVPVSSATLPCVLTATSADSKTVLHSLIAGSGSISSGATANVTPLTELLLAQLAGQDPAKYVAAFTSTTTVNASDVSAAQSALVKVLQGAGFDASGISDFLGGSIAAGSGQGYDGVLDKLQSTLTAAGATLTDLSTAVASTSGSSSTAAGSTIGTVMAPANSACPALKSGDHRLIKFSDGSAQVVTIDATKLTVAMGGSSYQLTQGATACDFSLNDTGATRVLVAKSGMAVWANGTGNTGTLSLSMPKQTIDPNAVNGVYNIAFLSGGAQGGYGTNTYVNGVVKAATNCAVGSPCAVDNNAPYGHLAATSDGGADWVDDGASAGTVEAHAYGFQNAQGNLILIAALDASQGGGVGIFAPQTTLAVPAVGTVSTFWQTTVTATGLQAVTEDSHTISAVNGSTVTRTYADGHTNQVSYNDPFAGLRHRAKDACTTTDGTTATTCAEVWQLPLGGLTLAWYGSPSVTPSKYQVNFSVNKPGN